MISNSRILITGGFGFIGGHLAALLSNSSLGNNLVLFDTNIGPQTTGADLALGLLKNIEVVKESILSTTDTDKLGKDFDYIIHAAGFLGIDLVGEKQLLNMDINVIGTKNCLELAAKQNALKKFVHFSTSEIYGVNSRDSVENNDSVIPTIGKRWSYAASKLAGEYYVKAYAQEFGVNSVIVRPFNVYGSYRHSSNAMTKLISQAINGDSITINNDGNQLRAWCHISDFCNGVIELMGASTKPGEAFNIGDDRHCMSIKELALKIVALTDSDSDINVLNNLSEDVLERSPNIEKAKRAIGYAPSHDLEKGILSVADWLRVNSGNVTKENSDEYATI